MKRLSFELIYDALGCSWNDLLDFTQNRGGGIGPSHDATSILTRRTDPRFASCER